MRRLLIYHDWMQVDVLRKYEIWFLLYIIKVLTEYIWACISANPCITSTILFSHSIGIDYHNNSNPNNSGGIAKTQSRYFINEWNYETTTIYLNDIRIESEFPLYLRKLSSKLLQQTWITCWMFGRRTAEYRHFTI